MLQLVIEGEIRRHMYMSVKDITLYNKQVPLTQLGIIVTSVFSQVCCICSYWMEMLSLIINWRILVLILFYIEGHPNVTYVIKTWPRHQWWAIIICLVRLDPVIICLGIATLAKYGGYLLLTIDNIDSIIKNAWISKCYFLRRAHSTEKTSFTKVFQPGPHLTAESTEAIQMKCLAQGHIILMQTRFGPSIPVYINRHLTHMTNMLHDDHTHSTMR